MDEEDLARHLASSKKWYTKLRKRAPLLGGDARMVEMRTEDLLALNRTAWRPYFQASLPAAVNAQNSSGPFPLTVGVKHVSDFVERRNAAGLKRPLPCLTVLPHLPAWCLLGLLPLLRNPKRRLSILEACGGPRISLRTCHF